MTHVDLFSGIGGFALAAQANGLQTVCFCEIDQRCRDFLSRSWPGIDIHDDIRRFDGTQYEGAFLLTAGVPCQPASRAGKQRGAADDRWLWPEAIRVLGQVKPTWAIFENPPGIGDVGLAGILSDMEGQGYEVRVFSIPACAVGAPHRRERYWIVANSKTSGWRKEFKIISECNKRDEQNRLDKFRCDGSYSMANNPGRQNHGGGDGELAGSQRCGQSSDAAYWDDSQGELANAAKMQYGKRSEYESDGWTQYGEQVRIGVGCEIIGDMDNAKTTKRRSLQNRKEFKSSTSNRGCFADWSNFVWLPCADGRVRRAPDDSIELVDGLHRSLLAALGNSIVWQVAKEIVYAIMEAEFA